ncbi:MAG: amidohydrolase [Clostridiaceae bacterium]|nr:amidohydrolase [Clostridiaceae bacterium]
MDKNGLFDYIEQNQHIFTDLSDQIWALAELSLLEYQSMDAYVKVLKKLDFAVETGVAGVKTAFTGTYGSGKPIIGILGEYDALSGLSQESGIAKRQELQKGGCGHGCGHNLLGAGALAAAAAVKKYLEEKGPGSGTVIFYGCPGEEGGAGKAFMAQKGLFYGLDAALTWHPGDVNEVNTGSCLSSLQVEYTFEGLAAHAAGCPHLGRSALDAVELMNIGVQFLREHMPKSDSIHYAITDAGGDSPNVVQPMARVLYMVRSDKVKKAQALLARVENIAKGAAQMTETKLSRRFIDGTADIVPNKAMEQAIYRNLTSAPLPAYTQAEWDFAKDVFSTYTPDELPGFAPKFDEEIEDYVKKVSENGMRPLNDFIVPFFHSKQVMPGSTDVGDVSWQTPTAQLNCVTIASGTPGHSWQTVAQGKSSVAHKGMLLAAKVLAATAADLFEQPWLLESAKTEWKEKAASGYVCPVEEGVIPTAVQNRD